ncbi:hypothetical protein BGW36DRAFT_124021 [Talaromyces proteolyticus]|uniref:Uncharacterized protein n=1 Tax=Talaromyces proteolyticus TaxID=1131652 RepID=A0AAD4KV56_9EURO|nr:uncharacterized protein BGW36DRAFT_124021 [Talaromyces proteolyticus]KAH8700173.1 hypothetical protein BGW36DRAFT_124021 [Talaromyces proteolyticus]
MIMALTTVYSLLTLLSGVLALRTTPGSPCTSLCGTTTNTTSAEIVCLDGQYNTTKTGRDFQSCVTCLLQSDFQSQGTGETDVNWGLYNLRYAFSSCVYNFPEPVTNVSTPCLVSCTPLGTALKFQLTSPVGNSLTTFCGDTAFADNTVSICEDCYALTSQQAFLTNFLESNRYNCHFLTSAGTSFPIAATRIFNETELPETTTAYTSTAASSGQSIYQQYQTVIIVMPIVGFLIIAAVTTLCCFCLVKKRRQAAKRRRYGSNQIHARWNDTTVNTPWQNTWGDNSSSPHHQSMMMANASQYMMGGAQYAAAVPGNGFQVVDHDGQHYEAGYSTHYVSPVDSDTSASQHAFPYSDQINVAEHQQQQFYQPAQPYQDTPEESIQKQKQPQHTDQEVYFPPPSGAPHAS